MVRNPPQNGTCEDFVGMKQTMESQGNGDGETTIARGRGSAGDGKHMKWPQGKSASWQLGTLPGPEKLPGSGKAQT